MSDRARDFDAEAGTPKAAADPPSPEDAEALEDALEAALGARTVTAGAVGARPRVLLVDPDPEEPTHVEERAAADEPAQPVSAGAPAQAAHPISLPSLPEAPADPLAEFFFSEGEHGPAVPDVGVSPEARADEEEPESRREYLTFSLGDEQYGLEIARVREILKVPPVTEVPRAPADVLGVISVRGEVIPVFDPRRRLRLAPAQTTHAARIVVCDAGAGSCGLLVDAVKEVVRLAPGEIEAVPQRMGGIDVECLTGIGRRADQLFILVDAGALLRPTARRAEGN